jgi:hypothetical protein
MPTIDKINTYFYHVQGAFPNCCNTLHFREIWSASTVSMLVTASLLLTMTGCNTPARPSRSDGSLCSRKTKATTCSNLGMLSHVPARCLGYNLTLYDGRCILRNRSIYNSRGYACGSSAYGVTSCLGKKPYI